MTTWEEYNINFRDVADNFTLLDHIGLLKWMITRLFDLDPNGVISPTLDFSHPDQLAITINGRREVLPRERWTERAMWALALEGEWAEEGLSRKVIDHRLQCLSTVIGDSGLAEKDPLHAMKQALDAALKLLGKNAV